MLYEEGDFCAAASFEKNEYELSSDMTVLEKTGKRKNTTGRKHISRRDFVVHRGKPIQVNAQGSGVYTATVKKSFEQFDRGLERWGRQLVVFCQLKLGYSRSTNDIITKLLKRVRHHFSCELEINEFGYHWCRELERGKGAHYHLAIWLDGDKYRTSHSISPIIQAAWEALGGQYDSLRRPYHFVDDELSRLDTLYRLSYLSKSRGKGNRPPQTKDHGMSRLKVTDTRTTKQSKALTDIDV
jgi:hypothetical protein